MILSTFLLSQVHAQNYKYVYYLDQNLTSTTQELAIYNGKGLMDSGLFRVDYFNKLTGKLFMSAHYTDSSLQYMQGTFRSFYSNGLPENDGMFMKGQEEGSWIKWDSLGEKTDSLTYHDGKKLNFAAYTYLKGKVNTYQFTDSTNDEYRYVSYNEKGMQSSAEFRGNNGLLTIYDSSGVSTKEITSRKLKDAEFPGGQHAYERFLRTTLNPMTPANHGAPSGMYTVIIKFQVEKNGSLSGLTPETHYGYGLEAEALRVIAESPKWEPASMFGIPVVALRRQPITFVVDNGDSQKN